MEKEKLYNWLFHYNHTTGVWSAFHREDHSAYWNGTTSKHRIYRDPAFQNLMIQLFDFEFPNHDE
jgi:hypothetical protein